MKSTFRHVLLLLLVCQMCINTAFSRNDTLQLTRSFGMKIGGFVRADCFYDTRQMYEAVEGMFSLYPMPQNFDANGKDINAAHCINLVSIASRVNTRFFAPDVLGAKSSALIEIDFTGTSNTNGLRLRHAYLDFTWTKTSLLIGRSWHPLANSMPNTLGINLGSPFWVFNRSDQVRFNFRPQNWQFSVTASYHSDYASLGPAGKSPMYLRNAIWPELTLNIEHNTPATVIGIAGSTKTIKPRQFTTSPSDGAKYATDETLTTFAGQAYFQHQSNGWKIRAQSTYHQNMNESLMIGGYAVSTTDPVTGYETYTPTQYMNYWLNVVYGVKWQTGFFAGYLNSLGTLDHVTGAWYARDPNIKYMYRLAPHLIYNISNWHFGVEFEYTVVSYGEIQGDNRGKIINNRNVSNFRTLLSVSFYL